MVVHPIDVSAVFHALAHEARRDILRRLAQEDLTVGELAEPLNMSLAAASKHVRVLEETGLLRRDVVGRRHICRLEAMPLAAAADWLREYHHFWTGRLDALDALMRSDPKTRTKKRKTP